MSSAEVIYEGRPSCIAACGDYTKKKYWRITTQYIEYETGWCCKEVENLQMLKVQDVRFDHGKCCCSCCATITLNTADKSDPILYIRGLPDSETIFKKIRNAMTDVHSNAKLELDA